MVLATGAASCGDAAANDLTWASTEYCPVFRTDMGKVSQSWHKMLYAAPV